MTILRPNAFKKAPSAGFDGVFDWDFLLPAFEGTRIEPMDLDAFIERRGNFLGFETKDGNVPIPEGQTIALRELALTGRWVIIVLRAKTPDKIDGWDVWYRGQKSGSFQQRHEEGNAADLVAFVRRWFAKASAA